MRIPHRALAPETLENLIAEFVTRDGTDYGEQEVPLAEKIDQVRRLLDSGEAVILFSESTGQSNIVSRERLNDRR